jgi:hypothetical protein
LTATIAVAALVLAVDLTMLAVYTRSTVPAQPLVALAVTASLVRITCSVTTLRHAIAIRHEWGSDANR